MQDQRRPFVCKRCGTNIDTRRRREDGSLQCPRCKMVYRPRPTQPQQQSPMRKPQKRKKPVKLIIGFVVLLLLIIILIGSCGNSNDEVNSFSDEFIQAAQRETEFEKTLRTYTAKPTQMPVQGIVRATQVPTQTPTEKPSLFPQTIFNKNGVKINITSYENLGSTLGYLGPEIKITIENNSGTDLIINTGSLHFDGWQIAEYTSHVEVAKGAKAGETIYIYDSQLEDCGLSRYVIDDVQFKGAYLMSSDYMNKYEFEMTATLQ